MTMKDKLASYNHLIETFVIVTETFLCGLLFLLFSKLSNEMQWDSLQVGGTTVLQVMLTLMLCYALCAIHSGVVLHRRKVHSLQIWKRVFENMFLFVLLGGLVLSVGKYADIASLFMLEYLFLLFLYFSRRIRNIFNFLNTCSTIIRCFERPLFSFFCSSLS